MCKLGTLELVWGAHEVPAGDTGVVAVVSVDRGEAKGRLRTIAAMLEALGIYDDRKRVGSTAHGVTSCKVGAERIDIELESGQSRAVQVFTGTVGGVSGFTGICLLLDEVSKWKDKDTGANPGTEVIRSIRPTIATQPRAVLVASSSPWGESDAHAELIAMGNTERQRVTECAESREGMHNVPTWVANPTVTREQTILDEPDEPTWAREYEAIPMPDVVSEWFTKAQIEGCLVA